MVLCFLKTKKTPKRGGVEEAVRPTKRGGVATRDTAWMVEEGMERKAAMERSKILVNPNSS